ncbi:MAG: zinc-ribbon domain containing protein [Fuerstiella sp.]
MSPKRKRNYLNEKRRKRGETVSFENPDDNVVWADVRKQVPNSSWGPPVEYYVDIRFQCVDCDSGEIWTAKQQKWYYEEAKGSLYATAVRCKSCREKRRLERSGKAPPNPLRTTQDFMRHLETELAEPLTAAGFTLAQTATLPARGSFTLDYSRGTLSLSCWYDASRSLLIAETLDGNARHTRIAKRSRTCRADRWHILERITEFTKMVSEWCEDSLTNDEERVDS